MASAYDDGILAVIRCGLDQGMPSSAFGGEERAAVLAMARRGMVRIVSRDRVWVYATLPDTRMLISDKGRGQVELSLRDGVVAGAVGSEPERFIGLTEPRARQLASGGTKALARWDARPNPALMGVRSQWVVSSGAASWHQQRAGHMYAGSTVFSGDDAEIRARVYARDFSVHHPSTPLSVRESLTPIGER